MNIVEPPAHPVHIGIDVAKATLQVDLQGKSRKLPNTPAGHQTLLGLLPGSAFIIMESTGSYHIAALQAEIEGVDTSEHLKSKIQSSTFLDWPAELPAQVAALRKLLPTVGQNPGTLAACFGRKYKKRVDQINGILVTLKALGHIA